MSERVDTVNADPERRSELAEVARAALTLGLTSSCGPIAHLGYFHEYVVRRRWLDEAAYSDLVTPIQSLPRPASSQLWYRA